MIGYYLYKVSGEYVLAMPDFLTLLPMDIFARREVVKVRDKVLSWEVADFLKALTRGGCFPNVFRSKRLRGNVSYRGLADFIQKDIGNDNFRPALTVAKLRGLLP